jgi:hypothetical protein
LNLGCFKQHFNALQCFNRVRDRVEQAEVPIHFITSAITITPTPCRNGTKKSVGRTKTMENIIIALITGGITLFGVLISNGKAQAVTETRIDELTREVREHNNFAKRMPVVEEQIRVINHRIDDLEGYHKPKD